MCAYISRVERKKERRKKIFFWSFIIADILIGVWIGIFSFNESTRIIEGEITPREKLIREEGLVTDWKYVYNIGTKYHKSEHYFMIELDFEKTYKVKTYALDAFDRKKFEKFGTGSYVTLLLDEQKGYGEDREVEIAEVRSEDICYLSYEDYVYQQYQYKEFELKTRWLFAILFPVILAWWPIYFIIWEWWKKRKKDRIKYHNYLRKL